ncbi:glucosyltransferase [Elasticomyces elasticus]|nr:glucosyltransferase [Elasticomyces elasticus]KAK3655818.1 glucosyltransferase [Elasticomyces elasticus]KAK4925843.1 glucosyltransferase [Elasticomyces elasticus]KAK5764797.1 glucosyltransferase [Elasticomyces elasticus]
MAATLGALLVPLSSWFLAVNRTVTEPYLDEVFHVRQAQVYCRGRFDVWDPKITTPPGLYLLSYAASGLERLQEKMGLGHQLLALDCSLTGLRAINAVGVLLLFFAVRSSYLHRAPAAALEHRGLFEHSALNVVLFPPLFFFSALYYTDVWSALSVVASYAFLSKAYRDEYGYWLRTLGLVALGLVSLMFRQTNIFWITALPAGIVLVKELDCGHQAIRDSMHRKAEGFGDTLYNIAKTSWKMGVIYDPPIRDAWVDDFALTTVSITACLLRLLTQPKRVIKLFITLGPYLVLAASFAAFIIWNGGVVLGDKSNHVATLHAPQMLYLWPFVAFFSWPMLYPYLLLTPVMLLTWLPVFGALEAVQLFKRSRLLPRLSLALIAASVACAVIWGNTIVHPFTLADNRHYIFYAFRRLLRPWWVRYAASPIYVLCCWACTQVLGAEPADTQIFAETMHGVSRKIPIPDGQHSARISFGLVLVATSILQLITAPLVEPRYFILPWMFWRMHVPLRIPVWTSAKGSKWSYKTLWEDYDHRLWFETAWLLFVNAVTGYIFLYWGFAWPQEPDKVQRFMW